MDISLLFYKIKILSSNIADSAGSNRDSTASTLEWSWQAIEAWGRQNPVALAIIVSLLVFLLSLFFALMKRKVIKVWWEEKKKSWRIKKSFHTKSKGYLKDIKCYFKANSCNHPAAGMLMAMVAKRTAADIFSSKGKYVHIDEYVDMLKESLSENLGECIFVARTKPSDWYIAENDTDIIKTLKLDTMNYLRKQGELKHKLKNRLSIKRYIVIPSISWNGDPNKQAFINLQNSFGVTLAFCPRENLPSGFPLRDIAIFKDTMNKGWIVESLDFDEDTISKYANSKLPLHIKVRIEDRQSLLNNEYQHFIGKIDSGVTETYNPES